MSGPETPNNEALPENEAKKPEQRSSEKAEPKTRTGNKKTEPKGAGKTKGPGGLGGKVDNAVSKLEERRVRLLERLNEKLSDEDLGKLADEFKEINGQIRTFESLLGGVPLEEQAGILAALKQRGLERGEAGLLNAPDVPSGNTPTDISKRADPGYHKEWEVWFEGTLQFLERSDLPFDQEAVLWRYVSQYMLNLHQTPETRGLAERLSKILDARRSIHNAAVLHKYSTPDVESNNAGTLERKHLRTIFTFKAVNPRTGEEEAPVAEGFRQFESLAEKMMKSKDLAKAAKEKGDEGEEERLKAEVKESERQIDMLFAEGGEYETGTSKEEKLQELLAKGRKTSPADKKEIEALTYEIWRGKIAGGLWSVMGRAAKFDLKSFNGLGDFMYARLFNPSRAISENDIYGVSEMIWKDWDWGAVDEWTTMLGSLTLEKDGKKGERKGSIESTIFNFFGNKEKEVTTKKVFGETPDKDKEVISDLPSLARFKMEDERLWEMMEGKVSKSIHADFTLKLKQIDENIRKPSTDVLAFLNRPTQENYEKLAAGAFQNIGAKNDTYVEVETNSKRQRIKTSDRQLRQQELLERYIEWGKYSDSSWAYDGWAMFEDAEVFIRIKKAKEMEAINISQVKFLMGKYLNFPFGKDAIDKARNRAMLSLILAPFNYPPYRNMILFGAFIEMLKRGFKYIFS